MSSPLTKSVTLIAYIFSRERLAPRDPLKSCETLWRFGVAEQDRLEHRQTSLQRDVSLLTRRYHFLASSSFFLPPIPNLKVHLSNLPSDNLPHSPIGTYSK
jgi:hypothetical protein